MAAPKAKLARGCRGQRWGCQPSLSNRGRGFGGGEGNVLTSGGGGAGLGGAVFNLYGTLRVTDSTLTGNAARGGGSSFFGSPGDGFGGAMGEADVTGRLSGSSGG